VVLETLQQVQPQGQAGPSQATEYLKVK